VATKCTGATKIGLRNLRRHSRAVKLPPPAYLPVFPFSRLPILFTAMLVVIICVNNHYCRPIDYGRRGLRGLLEAESAVSSRHPHTSSGFSFPATNHYLTSSERNVLQRRNQHCNINSANVSIFAINYYSLYIGYWSQDSVVSIATGYGLDDRGV
jgi:hypothetical protein